MIIGMRFTLQIEEETDGRWIVEIPEIPGTLAYGTTQIEAISSAKALALRVIADQLEHGEANGNLEDITFAAA
jgi:predicted RNase H-like HicB family nuclease